MRHDPILRGRGLPIGLGVAALLLVALVIWRMAGRADHDIELTCDQPALVAALPELAPQGICLGS